MFDVHGTLRLGNSANKALVFYAKTLRPWGEKQRRNLQPFSQTMAITYSRMFTTVKGSILLTQRSGYLVAFGKTLSFKIHCCSIATASAAHENAPKYSASRCGNLFSRINVGEGRDIVQALDQWVAEGGKAHSREILRISRDLRSRKRFSQALQVWFLSPSFLFRSAVFLSC